MENTKNAKELRELKAMKNNYDSIIKNMNVVIKTVLDVYPEFENKEILNTFINMIQDFSNKAVTESNNILIKMLSK